jgi:hypothetical protein
MLYKESEVPKSVLDQRRHPSEPYPSPTHAGGTVKPGYNEVIRIRIRLTRPHCIKMAIFTLKNLFVITDYVKTGLMSVLVFEFYGCWCSSC